MSNQMLENIADEVKACRHLLHRNPQTSYEETFAQQLICKKLKEWGIDYETGIAVTGTVATIKGRTDTKGRVVGLRTDIDALNIEEQATHDHISQIPGKMHGCGHDGHTAMLLGAAKYLAETRNFDGTVHLIFQPAEEGGGGAHRMIDEGLFKRFPMNMVFGLHNWPSMKRGTIGLRAGTMMAAVDEITVTIKGKGGHAAYPHRCADPIVAGSALVQAIQSIVSRRINPVDSAVVSVTNFNAGTGSANVIPDTATIQASIRTLTPETRAFVKQALRDIVENISASYGVGFDFHYREGTDPTINTPDETLLCMKVARAVVGNENVDSHISVSMGGEDFGAMLQIVPGCYIRLGQGEDEAGSPHNEGLHASNYDFNDRVIPIGIQYWAKLVETALPVE